MPSVYIETFGCQMNVADSEMLAQLLAVRGYAATDNATAADLIVVNTCSVREHAERRARVRINEYATAKRKATAAQQIWVVGCMAERLGEQLKEQIPGIDQVIGAQSVEHLAHDIDGYLQQSHAAALDDASHGAAAGVSGFLPIMRGCDNFCAYCIVPHVRGREHSVPAAELEHQARAMVARGVREITLLGQNVNSYADEEIDFARLLHRLHDIDGLLRLRFTTSHPKDCSDQLIAAMARLPKLCNHIHLPVQSGSSAILAKMNRRYTREHYLGRIEAIRAAIPDIDITTDVMVGFPGETDKDFQETLSLFRQVRYTTAFMFAYSERKGTTAADMSDQLPVSLRKERLNTLIELQTAITREHYDAAVGSTAQVLVTGRQDRRDRMLMGQDYGAKRVLISCDQDLTGTILPVKIVKSTGMTLIGERI